MSIVLEIKNLVKRYAKPKRLALDGLSLTVEKGAIYAFVGQNGAGKTTTIRIASTLLAYDEGSVHVCGHDVAKQKHEIRQIIGYIPDVFGFYSDMYVREYLEFFSRCYGIDINRQPALVSDLLGLVGLVERQDDPVGALSRGMQQRLALARALINDPELIIADEPAANLDPRARFELREMFNLLGQMGKTIFISSHILRELDDIATHVGIIEGGKMVFSGPVEEVRGMMQSFTRVRISFLGDVDNAHAWLDQQSFVHQVFLANGDIAAVKGAFPTLVVLVDGDEETVSQLLSELVEMHFPVYSYAVEQDNLERIFLQLTQNVNHSGNGNIMSHQG